MVFLDGVFPRRSNLSRTFRCPARRSSGVDGIPAGHHAGSSGRRRTLRTDCSARKRADSNAGRLRVHSIADIESDPAFDRELPDPSGFAPPLARQYDVAVSLDVEAVPKPTRDLIFNVLSTMMSTQHQQRDDEPDTVYAIRDAWQQRDIAGLKLFFRDTQRITIGLNVDREQRGADIDFVIDAREASEFLEEILLSSTKPSYFTPLIDDQTPVLGVVFYCDRRTRR